MAERDCSCRKKCHSTYLLPTQIEPICYEISTHILNIYFKLNHFAVKAYRNWIAWKESEERVASTKLCQKLQEAPQAIQYLWCMHWGSSLRKMLAGGGHFEINELFPTPHRPRRSTAIFYCDYITVSLPDAHLRTYACLYVCLYACMYYCMWLYWIL